MTRSDIVVVGASAAGMEALTVLAAGFPADLRATVFMVLHVGAGINGRSELPRILERAGPLPAKHPMDGEQIQTGAIYVAPPDYHMTLSDGRIQLSRGPKENRTRPAINPLFRSAARAYRGRVTGVILTGLLDDGVAGLAEVKRRGGTAIVQDPATAKFPSMPANTIEHVPVDEILPLGKISYLASTERAALEREEPMESSPIDLTCPECSGPIREERQGRIVEYRCRVGHVYSPLAMAAEHEETVERALWATVVALEQSADIAEHHLVAELGTRAAEDARKKRQNAAAIRKMLNSGSVAE